MPSFDFPPVTTSSPGGLVTATYLSALRRTRDLSLDQAANTAGLSGSNCTAWSTAVRGWTGTLSLAFSARTGSPADGTSKRSRACWTRRPPATCCATAAPAAGTVS